MIAITADVENAEDFRKAVDMVLALLSTQVQTAFEQFCEQNELGKKLSRERLWAFAEMSIDAMCKLSDLVPQGMVQHPSRADSVYVPGSGLLFAWGRGVGACLGFQDTG